jgi:hypothetical protein
MSEPLPALIVKRRIGTECLHLNGAFLPFTLMQFWQWSESDLVSNITRGKLAEFIVATALGIDVEGVRNEWDAFDLTTPSGLRIEVKSSAFLQSWYQKRLSNVKWRISPTHSWDAETSYTSGVSKRQADIYVFALLHHLEQSTLDPLDLTQWCFWIVPTALINSQARNQKTITLNSLKNLVGEPISYSQLLQSVESSGINTQKHN